MGSPPHSAVIFIIVFHPQNDPVKQMQSHHPHLQMRNWRYRGVRKLALGCAAQHVEISTQAS